MAVLGKVYLIGAGPGAADLITVRGARLLAQADVVLYDALVTPEMLELCAQAEKISVGKRSGQRSTAQTLINEQLVDCARRFKLVVRLKGGDPMLFGRADEELRALEEAGIEVEIVPGITTAVAAAAATKQPLTKRGVARSVAFFTSSTAPTSRTTGPCRQPTPWCSTWAGAKPPPPPAPAGAGTPARAAGGGHRKLQPSRPAHPAPHGWPTWRTGSRRPTARCW
jgi:uroporphyrin-III C-methyltransferase